MILSREFFVFRDDHQWTTSEYTFGKCCSRRYIEVPDEPT